MPGLDVIYTQKGKAPGERRKPEPKGCAQRQVAEGPEGATPKKIKIGEIKMKYYNDFNKPNLRGATFLSRESNALNPLPGLTFVTISYWKLWNGEIIGVVS